MAGSSLEHAGRDHGVEKILGVRQIGPALAIVADAAELDVAFLVGVLQLFEEGGGVFDDGVVLAVIVRFLEGHDGDAGGVVGQSLVVDAAVGLDALFQIAKAAHHHGIIDRENRYAACRRRRWR